MASDAKKRTNRRFTVPAHLVVGLWDEITRVVILLGGVHAEKLYF